MTMHYSMVSDGVVTSAGRVFAVADRTGNFRVESLDGLYAHDTRFLSRYSLSIEGKELHPLEARAVDRNVATYYCIATNDALDSPDSITVMRDRRLSEVMHDHISFINQSAEVQLCRAVIEIGADFADLFEVRRWKQRRSGHIRQISGPGGEISFQYERDEFTWITRISFDRPPDTGSIEEGKVAFTFKLPPRGTESLAVVFVPVLSSGSEDKQDQDIVSVPAGAAAVTAAPARGTAGPARQYDGLDDPLATVPKMDTVHFALRNAYDHAVADLRMLEIDGGEGRKVLAAGIPWFMALFGRDSIITSLQVKLLTPWFMINTLEALAGYQATEFDSYRESEPGKIPHEIRTGELSHFGEVPHLRYYGSVDSTPLFLVLVAEAFEWTGDLEFARRMLPAAEMCLDWIDKYGDVDGDGLVEYQNHKGQALRNQCWKDSEDSISFADGQLADGPIASIEVQGYVYHGKRGMARIYRALGMDGKASRLDDEAGRLQRNFEQAFWLEEEGYYAIALDGRKRRVNGISSNPGHCLWSGIVSKERAKAVAARLMADDMFSGWGIRTLSTGMARYHPLSYHNGSVWPHDCSIIAAGLSRYGYNKEAREIIGGLLDAAAAMPNFRLPELFAGYSKRKASFPVPYPLANAPQAWAAGAVIYCLETLLQIKPAGDSLVSKLPPLSRPVSIQGVEYHGSRWGF